MLNDLNRLVKELFLVKKILPLPLFITWLLGTTKSLNILIKTRSLGILDRVFGESFHILWNNQKLYFTHLDFGVVREIYGHCCYVSKGNLKEAQHILDLGANGGAFTVFALSEAPEAKIYAVEAQSELAETAIHNINMNGFEGRATVECAVVGGFYDDWTKSLLNLNPQIKEFDIRKYIENVGICDFLKCDVEGAEFFLFKGDLTWTQSVKNMALEYHPDKGNADELENILKSQGFIVRRADHRNLGYFYCTRVSSS